MRGPSTPSGLVVIARFPSAAGKETAWGEGEGTNSFGIIHDLFIPNEAGRCVASDGWLTIRAGLGVSMFCTCEGIRVVRTA